MGSNPIGRAKYKIAIHSGSYFAVCYLGVYMPKAILFDFDGTIVDSLKHIHASWKDAYAKNDIDIDDKEIVDNVFYATREERGKKYAIDTDKLHADYYALLLNVYDKLELQEHIDVLLRELKMRGILAAIITSGKSAMVRKVLTKLNAIQLFDIILGSEDVERPKPYPDIAIKAMDLLKVQSEETLMIGDSMTDIETGKNAHIRTALYIPETNSAYANKELLSKSKPDYEFTHFSEFLKLIEK